jgi:glycosyltransferase involved in cell wall biosynthesis
LTVAHPFPARSRTAFVPQALFQARHSKRRFCLGRGRICPEKGYHLAFDAAALSETPLLLAGEVFRYAAHEEYFRHEILPRLGRLGRYLGPVGFRRKRCLLAAARCLVVPSLIAQTSSLVAMEAMACGIPIACFHVGALVEIVEPGETGFVVSDTREMANVIKRCTVLDPQQCRRRAWDRFRVERMCEKYFAVYRRLTEVGTITGPEEPTHGHGTRNDISRSTRGGERA